MNNITLESSVTFSERCQDVMVDGHRFAISIFSTELYLGWCLDIIDEFSMSHGWSVTFETEAEALEAAMIALEDEGAAGFLQADIVPVMPNLSEARVRPIAPKTEATKA